MDTYRRLRAPVLVNPDLSTKCKLDFVQSLLESKLFYGAGIWTLLTPALTRKLGHAYMVCIRAAMGMENRKG
eukprot:6929115-Alexandrium_andersonii.AAC.1